jgi:hypothetical protein
MIDLSLAIYQRMSLDQLVRSTAKYIMDAKFNRESQGDLEVTDIVDYFDLVKPNYELRNQQVNSLQVINFWTCELIPNTAEFPDLDTAVDNCDSLPFEHYRLSATMLYRGLFVGNIQIPFTGGTLETGADGLTFSASLQLAVEA